MGNYVNTGNAGFAAAVRDTYVDKTELIRSEEHTSELQSP